MHSCPLQRGHEQTCEQNIEKTQVLENNTNVSQPISVSKVVNTGVFQHHHSDLHDTSVLSTYDYVCEQIRKGVENYERPELEIEEVVEHGIAFQCC